MDSSESILVIVLILLLVLLLVGFILLINRSNKSNQELLDIEKHFDGMEKPIPQIQMYEKAIVKEDTHFQTIPLDPPPIMTPKKDTGRASVLHKIYSLRKPSSPRKPSSIRHPSFLPMQENTTVHPPTYEDSVI